MSKTPRAFEPAADVLNFSADDDAIKRLAKQKGVTDHGVAVRALEQPETAPAAPVVVEEQVALTVMVPKSVAAQLKVNAATERGSQRYQVLKGLQTAGFIEIDDTALVQDRRSSRKSR